MAYNEKIADRIREIVALTHDDVEEKKMFGGLCFMVNGKMSMGVVKERMMLRVDPSVADEALEKEGCIPMDFTKKPMKGFLYIEPWALNTRQEMEYWVGLALEYNKIAKASKK
jgi:TfoX/Sxy family transcriptional regulator of competence genes